MTEYLPAYRLLEVLDDWQAHGGRLGTMGDRLHRAARRIRTQEWVSLDLADLLLVAIGRSDAWYHELADIYCDGFHVVSNPSCPIERYDSAEQRIEARRRTWRDSKRIKRGPVEIASAGATSGAATSAPSTSKGGTL